MENKQHSISIQQVSMYLSVTTNRETVLGPWLSRMNSHFLNFKFYV